MLPATVAEQKEESRAPAETQVPAGDRVVSCSYGRFGSSRSLGGGLIPISAAAFPSSIAPVIAHLLVILGPFIICVLNVSYSVKPGVVYFLGR